LDPDYYNQPDHVYDYGSDGFDLNRDYYGYGDPYEDEYPLTTTTTQSPGKILLPLIYKNGKWRHNYEPNYY